MVVDGPRRPRARAILANELGQSGCNFMLAGDPGDAPHWILLRFEGKEVRQRAVETGKGEALQEGGLSKCEEYSQTEPPHKEDHELHTEGHDGVWSLGGDATVCECSAGGLGGSGSPWPNCKEGLRCQRKGI